MPARDDCVLCRLVGVTGAPVVCYAVEGDEGLAIVVEHCNEMIVAQTTPELDEARAPRCQRSDLLVTAYVR